MWRKKGVFILSVGFSLLLYDRLSWQRNIMPKGVLAAKFGVIGLDELYSKGATADIGAAVVNPVYIKEE